jgi:hypothetical protein
MRAIERIRGACVASAVLLLVGCGPDAPPAGTAMIEQHDASHVNSAPAIHSLDFVPQRAAPGEEVQAVATASDPDGDPVTLRYSWTIDGRRLLETGPRIRLPANATNSSIAVTVVATDGEDQSEATTAHFRAGNRAPRLTALDIETVEIAGIRGKAPHWRVTAAVEDDDGNHTSVHYEWLRNGEIVAEGTDVFAKDRVARGDVVTVRATAFDGQSHSNTLASAPIEIANSPPEIVSTPPGLDGSGSFRYQPEVRDPDKGDRLTYRLLEGPEGMEIDPASGLLVWKPTIHHAGSHAVAFEVRDPYYAHSRQSFRVRVEVGGASAPGPAAAR